MRKSVGFTVVEVIVIIAVMGILATIGVVGYGAWQKSVANKTLLSDVQQAKASLSSYRNFKGYYPSNLAGTGFVATPENKLIIYTNTPTVAVYKDLNPDQNAQLLLNSCNAHIADASPYNSCTINGGLRFQIKGQGPGSATVTWGSKGDPIEQSDATLPCGPDCESAVSAMINDFLAQGGTFPVHVSAAGAALPEPTEEPNGPATRYCIEAVSGKVPELVYHQFDDGDILSGICDDNSLDYPSAS